MTENQPVEARRRKRRARKRGTGHAPPRIKGLFIALALATALPLILGVAWQSGAFDGDDKDGGNGATAGAQAADGGNAGKAGDGGKADGNPAVSVSTAPVERRDLAVRFDGVATVRAESEAVIAPEASGRIVRLNAPEGAEVQEGAELVALEVESAAAARQSAEAEFRTADAAYQRDRLLYDRGHVNAERLERSRAERDAALAGLNQAESALANRYVLAPFSGRVGFHDLAVGDYVSRGTPLFTLSAPGRQYIEIAIPPEIAADVETGARVDIGGASGTGGRARIAARDPVADPDSNLVSFRATVQADAAGLRTGRVLPVSVVVDEKPDGLVVPEAAVLYSGPEAYVFRVGGDPDAGQRAERVTVSAGLRRDGMVEIVSGLSSGDRVVVEGLQSIADGDAIDPHPADGGGRSDAGSDSP